MMVCLSGNGNWEWGARAWRPGSCRRQEWSDTDMGRQYFFLGDWPRLNGEHTEHLQAPMFFSCEFNSLLAQMGRINFRGTWAETRLRRCRLAQISPAGAPLAPNRASIFLKILTPAFRSLMGRPRDEPEEAKGRPRERSRGLQHCSRWFQEAPRSV